MNTKKGNEDNEATDDNNPKRLHLLEKDQQAQKENQGTGSVAPKISSLSAADNRILNKIKVLILMWSTFVRRVIYHQDKWGISKKKIRKGGN